ncbi:Angiogenic factor with G patch and FHA domains 1 [Kappamyces sp. JEL0829]|nr:Angiogenic factor with G patch and FHA domains 1 [Kappamyces sp. JEL0829]
MIVDEDSLVLVVESSSIFKDKSLVGVNSSAPLFIGRDKPKSQQESRLRIKQVDVSRTHCKIYWEGGVFFLVDLASSFGTLLNGRNIGGGKARICTPQILHHADRIQVGDCVFVVHRHLTCEDCLELVHTVIPTVSGTISAGSSAARTKAALPRREPHSMTLRSPRAKTTAVTRGQMRSNTAPAADRHYALRADKPSSINQPIHSSNKGAAMLRKLGWDGKSNLGIGDEHIKEPIKVVVTKGKRGLGKR